MLMMTTPVTMPGEGFNSMSQKAQLSIGGVGGGTEGSGLTKLFHRLP